MLFERCANKPHHQSFQRLRCYCKVDEAIATVRAKLDGYDMTGYQDWLHPGLPPC